MLLAEHHPQLEFSWRWDGPLPVCAADGPSEPPGGPYEDTSGLLQPGLLSFILHLHLIFFELLCAPIFLTHISLVSFRSRGTCFTGSGRPRLRWKARAVWVTNEDVPSALKSLRNLASLWVLQKCFRVKVWILHHNKPQSLHLRVFLVFVWVRITVILVWTWAGVLRVSWLWTLWRILPPVTLMLTAGWVSPLGYYVI